jgi:hypothetical protein
LQGRGGLSHRGAQGGSTLKSYARAMTYHVVFNKPRKYWQVYF